MTKKIVFGIEGIHCGNCASNIEMALQYKEGVEKASVDDKSEKAMIEFDEKKVSEEELAKLIEDMGYKAIK